MAAALKVKDQVVIERQDMAKLFDALVAKGYRVAGPKVRDNAIVYEELASLKDLPEGWTDEQEAGVYRLKKRFDKALFGYGVGPQSWKKFLFTQVKKMWQADAQGNSVDIKEESPEPAKYAFFGMRPCEIMAMCIQDKIFATGKYADSSYSATREKALLIAVNCTQAGSTCFCASMKSGPKALMCFDLAMTEVLEPKRHYFVFEIGSAKGAEALKGVPYTVASSGDKATAQQLSDKCASKMGRAMDTNGIKNLLYANLEHQEWDKVGKRCMSCANCTMVCPTCFCSRVEDVTDLTGNHAERWRKWDSCFNLAFTYIHGGSIRYSVKSRYRQWMTHKLASWQDQFGMIGCVGCGRCITWCPVGIDITAEARTIRNESVQPAVKTA